MDDKKYHCRYVLKPEFGEFEREDVNNDQGLCDDFVFISIIEDGKGNKSVAIVSVDGSTSNPKEFKPISDTELFQVWAMMACNLSNRDLPKWQKTYVSVVHDSIRSVMKEIDEKAKQEN